VRHLLSTGYLKAKFRAMDEKKSKPYKPVHLRQEPVPIVPGEKNKYAIAMLATSNVFQKGHSMELIIRNQDDMRSKIARSGVNIMPFMRSVTHTIYFGESHLLLPIIPADEQK
jgi:predicted acyl esterase